MDDSLDDFARKAGEAFVAAGRAATAEQRRRHRDSAENYQSLVRTMRTRARRGEALDPGDQGGQQ